MTIYIFVVSTCNYRCKHKFNVYIFLIYFSVNNMVRFMMRKGIITDLSRIPHSLDLSSPKMAATMNAVLKPLESLSRIMSCPSSVATAAAAKLKAKRNVTLPATDEPPSTQTGK